MNSRRIFVPYFHGPLFAASNQPCRPGRILHTRLPPPEASSSLPTLRNSTGIVVFYAASTTAYDVRPCVSHHAARTLHLRHSLTPYGAQAPPALRAAQQGRRRRAAPRLRRGRLPAAPVQRRQRERRLAEQLL